MDESTPSEIEETFQRELAAVPGYRHSWVRVDGWNTHYLEAGESGPPVLLIHGGGPGASAALAWREIIPALAERYRVYAPDVLGFGISDIPPPEKASFRRLARFYTQFVEALRLEPVRAVGNSVGATTVAKFALDDYEVVDRVALISSMSLATCLGVDFDFGTASRATSDSGEWDRERMLQVVRHLRAKGDPAVEDELITRRLGMVRRPGAGAWQRALLADVFHAFRTPGEFQALDMRHRLPVFHKPVRWIWGTDDSFAKPELVDALGKMLPDMDIHWVEGAGHQAQGDNPERVTEILLDFFDS